MDWAGVRDLPVHLVTSYENMHATKPDPGYFAETAALLGVDPHDALMVGDDRQLDLAAADIGMRTFYVGDDPGGGAASGRLAARPGAVLPRLVEGGE